MDDTIDLRPGAVVGRDFEIVRKLADGGMGAVYVAEQRSTGHRRALKVMHPRVVEQARNRERFAQEARVGARIESPHVVEVIAAGVDETSGTPWLAMELLDGEDLGATVRRRGALPLGEVREIFEHLGDALGRAHAAGIVHRDLKPENVFIARSRVRGVPFVTKVLDFGIAAVVSEGKSAATVTTAIGSPAWMAPEQANRGAHVGPATDVWALGLIAFFVTTGKCYWLGANVPDDQLNLSSLLVEIIVSPLVSASHRASELSVRVPDGFDAWFARCVDREPDRRFPNASDAVAALTSVLGSAAPISTVAATQAIPAGALPARVVTGPAQGTAPMGTVAMGPGLVGAPPPVAQAPSRSASRVLVAVGGLGAVAAVVALVAVWAMNRSPETRSSPEMQARPAVEPSAVEAVPVEAVAVEPSAPTAPVHPTTTPLPSTTLLRRTTPLPPLVPGIPPASDPPPVVAAPEPPSIPTTTPSERREPTPRPARVVRREPQEVSRAASAAPASTSGQGRLVVMCRPWCRVAVDGIPRGTSPVMIGLPAGRHVVQCTRGADTQRRTVMIGAGGASTNVSVAFDT